MAVMTSTTASSTDDGAATRRVRAWPVGWIAAAVYVGSLAAFLSWTIGRDGEFTYPLDDSYIHLRLGQNLAQGTLGMNPGEFASASSSAVWPLLIAGAVRVVGPMVGVPFVLAALCGVATLVLLDRWVRRRGHSLVERVGLMAAMIAVVPLTTLALTGMEHVLQVGAGILLVALVIQRSESDDADRRGDLAIGAAAAWCAAARLEAVFVVLPLAVLLVSHRRWRTLGAMALGSAAPVALVVAIDLGQGWPALPASVLIKSSGVSRAHTPAVLLVLQTRLLLVMALALALTWFGRRAVGRRWPQHATAWTWVALGACTLNLAAGLLVQVYRYEAYLVGLCIVAIAVNVHALVAANDRGELPPVPLLLRGMWGALATFAFVFGISVVGDVSRAMHEIHLQQVQMARFVHEACNGCTVVVNDIGAVASYGSVRIVDSVGLANREVVQAKLDGDYDATALDDIARDEGATMAMVYPHWRPGVPEGWQPVGSWTVHGSTVLGGDTVVVYSLDPARTSQLRESFTGFEVPDEVEAITLS